MCSASRLMVFNVCVKFHENMSSRFKVMKRTRKLLTDTHTHTEKKKTLYPHTSYAGGIIYCHSFKFRIDISCLTDTCLSNTETSIPDCRKRQNTKQ